jgi:Na+-transporting NADH:ubiquinone oxidoreductase subunit NqrB
MKYSNYDLIKNLIFNSIEAFDSFIIKFQNNVFRTKILHNTVFVFVPIHIKILNNQQRIEQLFNVLRKCQYKVKLLCFRGGCV